MSLRLLEVTLPTERAEEALAALEEHAILPPYREDRDGGRTSLRAVLETERREAVLDGLEERHRGDEGFRMVLLPVAAVVPPPEECALSAIVAAVGIQRDSVIVVIGAMMIAPLLGPNVALAFGTTLADIRLVRRAAVTGVSRGSPWQSRSRPPGARPSGRGWRRRLGSPTRASTSATSSWPWPPAGPACSP